jgi:hypothetical protein
MRSFPEIPTFGPKLTARANGRRRQRGASIAEFVIVAPFALLVVLGLIQLGLMFVAKQIVNEATFVAARAGAVQNARIDPMRKALIKALIPFYQDSTDTGGLARLSNAWISANLDLLPLPAPLSNLDITVLNPNPDVFADFGLTDSHHQTYIPNDSLEYRDYTVRGLRSRLSIQDANVLKIRVTYAYKLKVPLVQSVFKSVMCGFDSGVNAFGRGGGLFFGLASVEDCLRFYNRGRVPIVSYATVQMQTPAWQN